MHIFMIFHAISFEPYTLLISYYNNLLKKYRLKNPFLKENEQSNVSFFVYRLMLTLYNIIISFGWLLFITQVKKMQFYERYPNTDWKYKFVDWHLTSRQK